MNAKTDASVIDLIPAKKQSRVACCPFCRSLQVRGVLQTDVDGIEHYSVECIMCGALGPMASSQNVAAQRWNRRY